jgi:DNA-binding transcriptional LysR family regulator
MPSTSEREFRIGLGDIAEMIFLPKILKRFREQAPGITVRTANLPLEVLEQEMIAGDIDVVIGFYPNFSKGNFYQQHLFRDDFVCMMRAGHPALRRNFDLKDFCDALHVVPSPGNRRQDMFEDYLRSLGINRKVVFSTPHYLCIPYMVLSSDVVVTVPRECIEPFSLLPGLHFVETPFKSPVFDVKQHWHAMYHGDPANRWLRALLYECFAANGPEPVAGTR